MDFSDIDFQSFVPGVIPAEHSMLFLVAAGVCSVYLLVFGVPKLLRFLARTSIELLKRASVYLISLALDPLYERFPKFEEFVSKTRKRYYKAKGVKYFEINTIEDAMEYLRYQEEYRKANRLPVSWLYDRISGDLLPEAAEALRKLSVIPDQKGVYRVEVEVEGARNGTNGNGQQRTSTKGTASSKKKANGRFDFKTSETRSRNKKIKKPKRTPKNPHWKVLDIPAGSSKAQVKKAYRRKMKEYHPDMVTHLGPELQKLALEKTRAVQMAYESLSKGG